jgi:multiple antibiotic resistance protein
MDDITTLIRAVPLAFAALLPLINPVGTAMILLGLTQGADDKARRRIARSVSTNTVLLLAVVLVAGRPVLAFFGVSVPIVQLAGGIVLAAIGWSMLFKDDSPAVTPAQSDSPVTGTTDFSGSLFYPFTFPITVGPGGIAVAITLSAHTSRGHLVANAMSQLGAFIGIAAVAVVTYVCLANAGRLAQRLGPSGVTVLMRLSAFLIVCLGAEISWSGLRALIESLPNGG